MRFYGNGIVRLSSSESLRFSKPAVKYEKGFVDVENEKLCKILIGAGYDYDKLPEPEIQPDEIQIDDPQVSKEEPEKETPPKPKRGRKKKAE